MSRAVVSLNTGLEDAQTVTVAFLVAVSAAEQGRPTLMFLTQRGRAAGLGGFRAGGGLRRAEKKTPRAMTCCPHQPGQCSPSPISSCGGRSPTASPNFRCPAAAS